MECPWEGLEEKFGEYANELEKKEKHVRSSPAVFSIVEMLTNWLKKE